MKYLLDTNVCIRFMNNRSAKIRHRFEFVGFADICVSAVTRAEMMFGAAQSKFSTQTRALQEEFLNYFVSLPFDDAAANVYGTVRARLKLLGTPIGPNDLFIASIALANNLTLVTHNVREFSRVEELNIEDWEAE